MLSSAQQRLWFLDRWNPGSAVYNTPLIFRVTGPLDIGTLEQSLNEIVRRHEALRTIFLEEEGQPVQCIAPDAPFKLAVTDLGHLPEEERRAESGRMAGEEAKRPFDLAQGPLFRANLLHLSRQEHVLILVMHHIVTDEWSNGVILRELGELYEAFSKGNPSPLPPLPVQYADHTLRQQRWLQGEPVEREYEYWKNQLSGLAVLELPTDHARPPVERYHGNRKFFPLSSSLTQTLKELSRRNGATLFMTLLAAFQTLLHRYSGQEDIAVGSPVANRGQTGLEGLVGYLANTLVLRTQLGGNPGFCEVLSRVREVVLGANEHQYLPFEKLVESINPERDPSRNPLFQVMMVLQNASDSSLHLPGLVTDQMKADKETAEFDLLLEMEDGLEGITGSFEYNTDLFDAPTIDRMIGHFRILLEGIIANPDARLSDLPILTEAERHQLLVEWNNTAVDYPKDVCLHHLFEAQVERTPDAVALVFEGRQLTY
ncbi:MAG: non-ribosomal peptide synthetase, partial [Acidobacteria bacterium]|nr:non-ribosomal peptide synthetase [Acidobacteriota bacterium]